jgi:hypothetical protein
MSKPYHTKKYNLNGRKASAVTPSALSAGNKGKLPKCLRACMDCGGPLPCITCARLRRLSSGECGQEPTDVEESDLALDSKIAELAAIEREGWDDNEHRIRSGLPPLGSFRHAPVHILGIEHITPSAGKKG